MRAPWRLRWAGHLGLRGPDQPLFRHLAGSGDPVVQIAFLAQLGFAGVSDIGFAVRAPEQQRGIVSALSECGLSFASLTHDPAHWAEPTWSVEPSARADLAEAVAVTIEAAARVRAHAVTCVTAFDPTRPREAQLDAFTANLVHFAGQAAAAGVVFCVEATAASMFPGMLVNRFSTAVAIVRRVNHPAVRLTFDSGHIAQDGDDVLAAFADNVDMIGAVQLCDAPGRIDPGAGRIPWPALMRAIGESGYAGLIEAEQVAMDDSAGGERALIERLRAIDRL
ncbi:MAG: TIM barrel protein [Hyphomonadaceae bacterium]|nr:TIM barrel protein [Hyphomonadaceae bacterium]